MVMREELATQSRSLRSVASVTIAPQETMVTSVPARSTFRPPDLIDFVMTPNRRLSAVRCQETEFRWC